MLSGWSSKSPRAKAAHPVGDRININLGTIRNERLTLTYATLSDCLKFAYDLVADAQLSGRDWMTSRFTCTTWWRRRRREPRASGNS